MHCFFDTKRKVFIVDSVQIGEPFSMNFPRRSKLYSIVEHKLATLDFHVPSEVLKLLGAYLFEVSQLFGSELVSVYVRGSLAYGGFDLKASDIDIFVVLEDRVAEKRIDELNAVHGGLSERFPSFGPRLEVAYLSRSDIKKFTPNTSHPTIVKRAPVHMKQHASDWILERAATIDHGIALLGPPSGELIERISSQEIRKVAEEILDRWILWAKKEDNPDWQLPVIHKAFVIQSTCRALYTVIFGELVTKNAAVDWALSWMEEPWSRTVRNSKDWRLQSGVQIQLQSEIEFFLEWVEKNKNKILHDKKTDA